MHDEQTLLNLIESVKNYSKLYSNLTQNVEDNIEEWTAVAQECKTSITEAHDQWNMLLNQYIEYLKNNQVFGFAQHMDFVQPYFFVINDKESIDEIELLNAIAPNGYEETNAACEEHFKNENTKINNCSDIQVETEEQKTKPSNPTLLRNTESEADCISTSQDNLITSMSSLELIFLGYAKQLQNMPTVLQLQTKRKIADIMNDAELQMIS